MNKELIKSYVSTIETDLTDFELAILVTKLSRLQVNRINNALTESALKDTTEISVSERDALQTKINQLETDNAALRAEIYEQRIVIENKNRNLAEIKSIVRSMDTGINFKSGGIVNREGGEFIVPNTILCKTANGMKEKLRQQNSNTNDSVPS
jgi:hypothetical protein